MKKKTILFVMSIFLISMGAQAIASVNNNGDQKNAALSAANIPLYFIENNGQANPRAGFYAKTPDFTLWLSGDGLVFDKIPWTGQDINRRIRDVSRLTFLNAKKNPAMHPLNKTGYTVNYYTGGKKDWKTNVSTYGAVLYKDVYQGIDLKVYGLVSSIEYDWMVKPESRPDEISFSYDNIGHSHIDENGNIIVATHSGKMVHKKPFAYQKINGQTVEIQVGFRKLAENEYGFAVGKYDKNEVLVIDPVVLTYSTYLGGATNPGDISAWPQDYGRATAVNSTGNAYVTGQTRSSDFPTLNAYDTALDSYLDGGDTIYPDDVFVTKFSADGSSLEFSTYIGGSRADAGYGIALDSAGNAYVTGSTQSSDFPSTAGVVSTSKNDLSTDSTDAFVVKLSSGGAMVFSTFLGGDASDVGNGIGVDGAGNPYVVGNTYSTDFPLQNAYDATVNLYWNSSAGEYRAYSTIFMTKLNATATAVSYSSYFGAGEDAESLSDEGNAIAVDGSGNAYLTGITKSAAFPLKNAYDSTYAGYPVDSSDFSEAVVLKIDPAQSGAASLVFSTFLGGTGGDWGYGIALDGSGDIYVGGMTRSSDFPLANPYQAAHGGGSNDGFVSKFNYTGATLSLVYSTYLGGTGNDTVRAVAANSTGNAFVTGDTDSTDFPTLNFYDNSHSASQDVFVTLFTTNGDTLEYSTYLGSTGQDTAYGIAVDGNNAAYITGSTSSTDFPTANPYMTNPGDGTTQDAFVSKLSYTILSTPLVTTTTASPVLYTSAASGGNVTANGGASVTARGVCWSTSANPAKGGSDSCTTDGISTGSFTSTLTGLTPGTAYHYRAYATNSQGTGYGADKTFTTLGTDLAAAITNDAGGAVAMGGNWTWTVSITNTGPNDAVFTDGQVILTDDLPDANISYGATGIANVTNITNSGFISAVITANTLTVKANGGSITMGASTGGFDVRFTATPSAPGTFDNPRSGGILKADPDGLITESSEANNTDTDTVAAGNGEINLQASGADIPDLGGVNFGTRPLSSDTDVEFTIQNTGAQNLDLTLPVSITGANASQFSIQVQPTSPVVPAGFVFFTVRFTPTSAGVKTAAIRLGNSDPDENPYDLTLQGTGQSPPAGGGGSSTANQITHDGQTVGGGNFLNISLHARVTVNANTIVENNGTLADVNNAGRIFGGEVSGDSFNSGILSNVAINEDSRVDNLGGTVSGGTNNGGIYGGLIKGTVENNGLIFGGPMEGHGDDPDYSVLIGTDARVEGGTVGGAIHNKGSLSNVTLLAGAVIFIENDAFGALGRLTGTITIAGDPGAATLTIPDGVSFPSPDSGPVVLAANAHRLRP